MAGRFWSDRDNDAIDQFNKELVEDVVSTTCVLYSVSVKDTDTNIYTNTPFNDRDVLKNIETTIIVWLPFCDIPLLQQLSL